MAGEAGLVRWGSKAPPETRASLQATPAHPVQKDGQASEDPLGLLDHQDRTASCLALKEHKGAGATLGLSALQG